MRPDSQVHHTSKTTSTGSRQCQPVTTSGTASNIARPEGAWPACHARLMSDLAAKASQLLRLHHTGSTLVLPTVWDAWSAAIVVQERCRHDIDSDA